MPEVGTNPYAVLGVAEDCTRDELKRAYRELARQYHPDRNGGAEWATERWKVVNGAYDAITKPRARRVTVPGTSATTVAVRTPRSAVAVTAVALAAIGCGTGFILGKATGADVNAARTAGVAAARQQVTAAERRAFATSFRHSRSTSYKRALRETVASPGGPSE